MAMNTETQVHSASSIQEAMLVLARALDRIEALISPREDQWVSWQPAPGILTTDGFQGDEHTAVAQAAIAAGVRVEVGEDQTEIGLPPASPERMRERYAFAEHTLKIDAYAKSETAWDDKPTNWDTWADVYAHGGPAWLYHANRDFVMVQPENVRRQLVDDLAEDDPNAAHEMARDILKKDAETAPGNGVGPDPAF